MLVAISNSLLCFVKLAAGRTLVRSAPESIYFQQLPGSYRNIGEVQYEPRPSATV